MVEQKAISQLTSGEDCALVDLFEAVQSGNSVSVTLSNIINGLVFNDIEFLGFTDGNKNTAKGQEGNFRITATSNSNVVLQHVQDGEWATLMDIYSPQ